MNKPLITHHCHALGCKARIPPKLLMCLAHWRMVPLALQIAVLRHYRKGQELDKKPSREYINAARDAIVAVATREEKLPVFRNSYPLGAPFFWMRGDLNMRNAVTRYLDGSPLSERDLKLLQTYLAHWIDCPVWVSELEQAAATGEDEAVAAKDTLTWLRVEARKLTTREAIHRWLALALDLGINPL